MRTAEEHDHLSYSQISCYMACSLQYRLKYVEKIEPAFKSSALAFGSAIHESVAAYYQTKLEGDELRPDQMLDVYRDEWRRAGQLKYFKGDNEDSLTEKAKGMLTVFHGAVDADVQVVGVEEFFEIPLGGLSLSRVYRFDRAIARGRRHPG